MFTLTSFKTEPQVTWLGTFNIFLDEEGRIIVYYNGDIPPCMGKKIIDIAYSHCDTVIYSDEDVNKILEMKPPPTDTCELDTTSIKITRI